MAALFRPKISDYVINENVEVDTQDHEDHTFSGVMFTIKVKDDLPVDFIQVSALSIRGGLGPITVWVTPDSWEGKSEDQSQWTMVYKGNHSSSFRKFVSLPFSDPVIIPEIVVLVYVGSGLAHLSHTPFSGIHPWGAWRQHRQFVGKIAYGAKFQLWNPEVHNEFPIIFKELVDLFLFMRPEENCPLSWMPNDVFDKEIKVKEEKEKERIEIENERRQRNEYVHGRRGLQWINFPHHSFYGLASDIFGDDSDDDQQDNDDEYDEEEDDEEEGGGGGGNERVRDYEDVIHEHIAWRGGGDMLYGDVLSEDDEDEWTDDSDEDNDDNDDDEEGGGGGGGGGEVTSTDDLNVTDAMMARVAYLRQELNSQEARNADRGAAELEEEDEEEEEDDYETPIQAYRRLMRSFPRSRN
eukprot:CAMPEP_0114345364 /NCGR_PEP_ID=MMETSP0101-20121206/12161_1 /TAXON_ID=38822 ORGANISM="Pteridomonas danica, Strain PT" /NCGR_SAMPLE_ID=MMETSP0101 /ASSEMBLY_ACC=CAM_ASM_000211 /LENGTH=409 /DNA_ID=CAMNT_0001481269 /DNA_START=6 /DNA_END=1236 /DNA_ORIENTATION=+